mmetsp:Transcript_64303/g.151056  ORF Transcript_64303/g.151056 Transcript_64303/m.151056 type:complete len:172 (-) Transcript_64303:194-709(-)
MSGCSPGSEMYPLYAGCLENCTCGLQTTNFFRYCADAFVMNVTAHDLCLCLTTRCVIRCVESARCEMGENYSEDCVALEAYMPCSINCPGSSSSGKRWSWALSEWPCPSDLQRASTEGLVILEPTDTTAWIAATIGGSVAVLLVLAVICFCTCRYVSKGKAAMEEDMYGRA